MRALIKTALRRLVGDVRARSLATRLRGPARFSEAELVLAHFAPAAAPGVMVDVGAHVGDSFEPYLDRGWCVHAFEPDASNRRELLRRIPANPRLRVYDLAVSNHVAGDVPFFASEESTGISSLSAFHPTHREVQRVKVTTLAHALEPSVVASVDFLKIDAEGHDLFVLQGFPWERMTPLVVLCEFEDRKTVNLGYDHRALGDFLLARGYQVFLSEWYPIVRYGTVHRWRGWAPYPCAVHDPAAWGNFVALRPGTDRASIQAYVKRFEAARSA